MADASQTFALLNGAAIPESAAAVSIDDRGLLYGESVFTTLRIYGGDTIVVVYGGQVDVRMDKVPGNYSDDDKYEARSGSHYTLTHDATNNIFNLGTPDGQLLTFHDFIQNDDPQGLFESYETAGGQTLSADSYVNDRIQEFRRQVTEGGQTTTESFNYQYTSDDRVQFATLRRRVDTGAWSDIRRMEFSYYGASEDHGSDGDLKTVKQQIPDGSGGWTTTETRYFRYEAVKKCRVRATHHNIL